MAMSRFTALRTTSRRLSATRSRPTSFLSHGLLMILILAGAQVRLQPVRWWRSSTVVAALGITPEQATAIERAYEDSLPAQQHSSEEVIDATAPVAEQVRAQLFDEQLLRLTERLARAGSTQSELHWKLLERAAGALTPEQRRKLARVAAEDRAME
jgi:hypothetical protein